MTAAECVYLLLDIYTSFTGALDYIEIHELVDETDIASTNLHSQSCHVLSLFSFYMLRPVVELVG